MKALFKEGDVLANRYVVDGVLGQGGMGIVLSAVDKNLRRPVALKLMLPGAAALPGFADRFLSEAVAAAKLNSVHAVAIHDFAKLDNGAPYIVMERLYGEDLGATLARQGALPMDEAVDYVLQACEALGEAHALGIVHRDLKPANLFVAETGRGVRVVKILDFGIARLLVSSALHADQQKTQGQILGTPLYMSPEQRLGSSDVDARADIWALGVVLYELIAGHPPFTAEDQATLQRKVLEGAPVPLSEARAGVPAALSDAVMTCLEKAPARRHRDVAGLARALAPFGRSGSAAIVQRIANQLRVTPPVIPEMMAPAGALDATDLAPARPAAPPLEVARKGPSIVPPPGTFATGMLGTMQVDFGDESMLLMAIQNREAATFLVGAALTAPHEGQPGVPGVDAMIELVRAQYDADPDAQSWFDTQLAIAESNRYQAAFRCLDMTHGAEAVNRLIRRAVLRALKPSPDVPIGNAEQGDERDCRRLEAALSSWSLSPGVAGLGALIAAAPERYGSGVLTSNFDPLIEVSIRRARGTCFRTVLDGDGGLQQVDSDGCNVVHFHGDWFRANTLHTRVQLGQPRPKLVASLRHILRERALIVIAYGGWDDVFTRALMQVVEGGEQKFDVLWAFYERDQQKIIDQNLRLLEQLKSGIGGGRIRLYRNVDAHKLFPELARRFARRSAPPPDPPSVSPSVQPPGRKEANGGGAPPKPPRIDENVQFTVYRPRTIAPDTWTPLLAFAHLAQRRPGSPATEPEPVEEVERQAKQVLAEVKQLDYQHTTQDGTAALAAEDEITFVPRGEGLEFNPPRRSFLWKESVHREEFRLKALSSHEGKVARGRLTVFLGRLIIADVNFGIRVSSVDARKEEPRARDHAQPYRKIYASYSPEDEAVVGQLERYVATLGDKYMSTAAKLRGAGGWSDALKLLIEEASVFQLFWSQHSMRSPHVRKEWEFALSLHRPDFVRPLYWEDPLPTLPEQGLPPEDLRRQHFHRLGGDAPEAPEGATPRPPGRDPPEPSRADSEPTEEPSEDTASADSVKEPPKRDPKAAPHKQETEKAAEPSKATGGTGGSATATADGTPPLPRAGYAALGLGFFVLSTAASILLKPGPADGELLLRVGLGLTASVILFGALRSTGSLTGSTPASAPLKLAFRVGGPAVLFLLFLWFPMPPSNIGTGSTSGASSSSGAGASGASSSSGDPTTSVSIRLIGTDGGCPALPAGARVALATAAHPGADVHDCKAVVAAPGIATSASVTIELDAGDFRLEAPAAVYPVSKPIDARVVEATTDVKIRFLVGRGPCPRGANPALLVGNYPPVPLTLGPDCVATARLPTRMTHSTAKISLAWSRAIHLTAPSTEHSLSSDVLVSCNCWDNRTQLTVLCTTLSAQGPP
jgi:serine/threonine-protein kinase